MPETMPETPEQILYRLLTQRRLVIGVAESCTGGLLAHCITNIPGSSACFRGGIIAYDNDVKMRLLGVERQTLEQFGAVSAQAALEMARGACRALQAHVGLSTTGIAGPTGATPTKPVGLAFVALAAPILNVERVERYQHDGDRASNKAAFAAAALRLAAECLASLEDTHALCK